MYRTIKAQKGTIHRNESYVGETIETKLVRMLKNKEPIKDGSPLIFQSRQEGINVDMDIRTDRFEIAIEGTDKVTKAIRAKRDNAGKFVEKLEQDNKDLKTGTEDTDNKDSSDQPK